MDIYALENYEMEKIKDILKKKVILTGFHESFQAVKTIGKGSSAIV